MGFFGRLSTVVSSDSRIQASGGTTLNQYNQAFFAGDPLPDLWIQSLVATGLRITPELAMTISAFYSGVRMIAYDLATLPIQTFKWRDDGGKDRVKFSSTGLGYGGIGDLAYKLRWAPNDYQTAVEFTVSLIAQWLMRGVGYAEIVDSPQGFLGQLLPRHPDRVWPERLPSGRIRYKLTESNGSRYLTQDEMFVMRDLTLDGIRPTSRTVYQANTLSTILAGEKAAGLFFKSGMTAALLGTYKNGDVDPDREEQLHSSISRYAAGVENNFGLLLVPDDVTIKNLAIDPEKAQMMTAREYGVKEVARMLNLPMAKLGVPGMTSYASQVQAAVDYAIGTLRPIAVALEQSIQRDLILAKDTYFTEVNLDALMRGDPDARAIYYEKAIKNRWMRPSEVRLRENMNPDTGLDKLSEGDYRPGGAGAGQPANGAPGQDGGAGDPEEDNQQVPARPGGPANTQQNDSRVAMLGFLAIYDNAVRCLRRERAAVTRMAAKHADDPAAWRAGLREFYADQASHIGNTMRIPMRVARAYAAQHGTELETTGVPLVTGTTGDEWEREEATALALLATDCDRAA